jgi:hypothetical protein
MSDQNNSRMAGFVLVGAAVLGVIAMSVFPRAQRSMSAGIATNGPPAPAVDSSKNVDEAPPITFPQRERSAMSISDAAVDSLVQRCTVKVQEQLAAASRDSSDVLATERYGFKADPGRAQDSLIVEGTARGTDSTAAVWHCAATAYPTGAIATLRADIEDGWPGVPARFESAHAITIAAEVYCLQRMKHVLKEYEFRGVRRWRVADTLRVAGEAMPLNSEDLAADFHCSAVVRDNRIVSAIAARGK